RLDLMKLRLDVMKPRLDLVKLRLDVMKLRPKPVKLRLDVMKLRPDVMKLRPDVMKPRLDVVNRMVRGRKQIAGQLALPGNIEQSACCYNTTDEFEIGELAAREYVNLILKQ
ncbi:MAG: hypothetical protein JXB07_09835, partial [Anaerolineae bacterium]|nr:hypothetical protein [Anaerolineae bacterium]